MTTMRVLNDWLLLPERIALHEPTATAVIADVHLGYHEARRRQGDALPLLGVADVWRPVEVAMTRIPFRRLLIAGDLFERGYDAELWLPSRDHLRALGIDWIALVPGNHDRNVEKHAGLLTLFPDGCDLDDWRVVHDADKKHTGRIVQGHWHPSVRIGRAKCPCFVVEPDRLILPAFSPDAAGVRLTGDQIADTARFLAATRSGLVEVRSRK
jgi:metallophosphoesterase superfamily enzyme